MIKNSGWKTLSTKIGFKGKYLKIRVNHVRRPDGNPGIYEMVETQTAVMILPKQDDKFYMVEQYRYPVKARSWEFPQGITEGLLDLKKSAKKELQEELGLKTDNFTLLGNIWLAQGNNTQSYQIYLAEQFSKIGQELEESEADLIVGTFTEKEIKQMIRIGKIRASMTIAAFNLYLLNKES